MKICARKQLSLLVVRITQIQWLADTALSVVTIDGDAVRFCKSG
jgi:hypothetical protein